jgi:hypothetical protein
MLLPIFHQTPPAVYRRVLSIALDLCLAGLLVSAFLQLLDHSRVRLVAMLPFGVGLRALLGGRWRVLGIAHVLLPLGFRLVLVMILPISHRSILPVSLPLLRH